MQIAILGAGMCGLAIAWKLCQMDCHNITLFDPNGIGKGASGVAAGLLHAYAGAHAKYNWRAEEGINATQQLIAVAEKALHMPVANRCGIFRPATTEQQIIDFQKCAELHSDVHWRDNGIFLDNGIVVDCPNYLQGLWTACYAEGVHFEQVAIHSLTELHMFDLIIVAMGAATASLQEFSHLKLGRVKGQVLEFAWSKQLPPLPYPLNSHAYLLMTPGNKSCIVGATFEKEFASSEPDPKFALQELLPKVHAFFPSLSASSLIDCRAGIRATTPDRRPLLKKYDDKCWILTGMGSKGLLYHALYADELVAYLKG